MAEESEPTHERRGVAVRFGDLDGLSEIHDCGVRVALEKRDQSKFATRAICPSGFTEFLGERERLRPGALRQRWVEVLVSLALDDQHAKPKPLVALNQRVLKVVAQAFRDVWNWRGSEVDRAAGSPPRRGRSARHRGDKPFAGLGVERLRAGPDAKPSESVGFGDELMRVRGLSDDGRAQQGREQRTDDADQVKTVARHDSLPRFAGAPLMFYNCLGFLARHKVVIEWQSSDGEARTLAGKDGYCHCGDVSILRDSPHLEKRIVEPRRVASASDSATSSVMRRRQLGTS